MHLTLCPGSWNEQQARRAVVASMNKRYEMNFQALLAWIAAKTGEMRKRDFANSLEGVTNDFRIFSTYRTKEKPPKAKEKVNIEASYFEIEMKLKELNQPAYVPPEGHRVGDIEQVCL